MPSFTFSSVGDLFGAGTSVGAYLPNLIPGASSPVTGGAVATATVAADGSLSFSGLADDTAYVAYDSGSGKFRRFRSTPSADISALPKRRTRIRRPQLKVVTYDFAGWAGTNGVVSDDAAGYLDTVGKQLTYTVAASGRYTSGVLGTLLDLSTNGLAVAIKADDRTKTSSLDIEISSNSFANFAVPMSLRADPRITPDGEWTLFPVVLAAAVASVTDSAINMLRTRGQALAGQAPVVSHGMIATFPLDAKARVVVFLDDALDTNYEACKRALRLGVKTCVAVRPGALDTAGHMTTAQAKELHDRYGVEFVPHAYNVADHDNVNLYLDPVAFEASLKNLRDACIAKGLVNGIENYCYAPNYVGQRVAAAERVAYDLVVKYFPGLARTAWTAGFNGQVESQVPLDMERRLRVGMYTQGTNSLLANVQGFLDRTSYGRGVAIFVFHGLGASDAGLTVSRATFDSFMAEIGGRAAAAATGAAPLPVESHTLSSAFAA